MFRTLKKPLKEIKDTIRNQNTYWKPIVVANKGWLKKRLKKSKKTSTLLSEKEMHNAWGINSEDELKSIIKGLAVEKYLFILLALLPLLFFVFYNYKTAVIYLIMMPLFSVVALTKEWRLTCLKKGAFTPFKEWVIKGCQ